MTGSRFEEILLHTEIQLKAELAKARSATSHSGDKGAKVEHALREVLRTYLPIHLRVGSGKVYDAFGGESGQTDVVIANQDQPFVYQEECAGEYLIEGVSAVAEVKSRLTAKELGKTVELARKFKSMRPIRRPTDHPSNVSESMDETDQMPPFLLFAFESKLTLPGIVDRLSALSEVPPPEIGSYSNDHPQPPIDAVCVLGLGVAWNLRTGDGTVRFLTDQNRLLDGWFGFETLAPLAWTLSWLHLAMPRISRSYPVFGPYVVPKGVEGVLGPSDSGVPAIPMSAMRGSVWRPRPGGKALRGSTPQDCD